MYMIQHHQEILLVIILQLLISGTMKKHRENDKERSSDCNNQPASLSRTVRLRSPLPSPGPRLRSRSCTRERLAPASLQQTSSRDLAERDARVIRRIEVEGNSTCSNTDPHSEIESSHYLTSDEEKEAEEEEVGLLIPTYQDLLLHVVLRHVHDLQQGLLQSQSCPQQEEQLLLANLALQHLPSNNISLKTHCLVLRGEDGGRHPLQVPLWTNSRPSIGAKSTGVRAKSHQQLTKQRRA